MVRKQKGAISHICFEVDDLEEAIVYFRKKGCRWPKDTQRQAATNRFVSLNKVLQQRYQ